MLKNHLSQDRTNPQTQAPSMSPAHSYTLGDGAGSGSKHASLSPNEPEDDDDICPVCESECTCANRSRNGNSSLTHNYQTGYVAQNASKGSSGSAPAARPPSLKIRLTLQPRSHQSQAIKSSSGRSFLPKRKSKNAIQTYAGDGIDEENSGPSFHGESSIQGGAHDKQSKSDVSIPRKRGRPRKAAITAREAAKHVSEAKQTEEGTGQSINNVVIARQLKSSTSRRVPQIASTPSAKKKGKKLHGAAASSRARAQQRGAAKPKDKKGKRAAVNEDESSELSELDDEDDHPFGLPTFVPALSSSSNCSSSDSGDDTDSDCDKGIPPFPRPQHASTLLLVDNEYAQRKREYHNTWDIRVRKRSVGADGNSDADMNTDSGEEEEEEAEEEGDDEADEIDEDDDNQSMQQLVRYSGIATGWTDDEENSFDADLFFANLSDTSAESSGDEQMGDEGAVLSDRVQSSRNAVSSPVGLDVVQLSEAAAAGFLAPFAELDRNSAGDLPFGQGWDHLMDLDIDASRGLPLGSLLEPPIPGYEEAEPMMATSEEEEAVAVFDNCSQAPDDEDVMEIFEGSDDGETTEDEFIDVDGIATPRREVLLRFPASLGAIDPMSTVSSPVRGREDRGKRSSSPISVPRKLSRPSLKPGDFLSGRVPPPERPESTEPISMDCPSYHPASAPTMGCFIPEVSNKVKHVVITKSDKSSGKMLPCPYPAVRRLRGRGASVSMLSRSGSDRSYRSRTPSLLAAALSPLEALASGDFEDPVNAQLPLGEPIQLDDVIDTRLLEPDRSDVPIPESTTSETGEVLETCESDSERDRHLENLRRWDRIPIDAFRRTRSLSAANDLANKMNIVISTPRAPRPSDGFSYGSAAGGMMRGSPLSATLWESSAQAQQQADTSPGNRRGKLSSLLVSPVLLPTRDGDHTPTAERQQQRQQQHTYSSFASQHAAYTQQNIKSRKELRKEKKRNRRFLGSATSHIRHNHFPNAKTRATSSMQRIPSFSL